MAVPTSGTLELEELAREAYYGQYGGNATSYTYNSSNFFI